ncbi:MAG TPA: hypothetical protein VGD78_22630 [Chthoniobacterales bacterium]
MPTNVLYLRLFSTLCYFGLAVCLQAQPPEHPATGSSLYSIKRFLVHFESGYSFGYRGGKLDGYRGASTDPSTFPPLIVELINDHRAFSTQPAASGSPREEYIVDRVTGALLLRCVPETVGSYSLTITEEWQFDDGFRCYRTWQSLSEFSESPGKGRIFNTVVDTGWAKPAD